MWGSIVCCGRFAIGLAAPRQRRWRRGKLLLNPGSGLRHSINRAFMPCRCSPVHNGCVDFFVRATVPVLIISVLHMSANQKTSGDGAVEQRAPTLPSDEREDSYAIYSLLLRREGPEQINASARAIVSQTQRGRLPMCIRPAKDQESVYIPLAEEFERRNRIQYTLESRFDLPLYTLIPRGTISTFLESHPRSVVVLEVSAIGYNEDRSRALVYVGHYCGPLCGGGTYHLLAKKDGLWQLNTEFRGAPFLRVEIVIAPANSRKLN